MKCFKFFFFIAFFSASSTFAQDLNSFFEDTDAFFVKYVNDNKVQYQLIKEDSEALTKLTNFIAAADVSTYTDVERKAFYINSYNLLVIKTVVDHYPIAQPLEVAGFFDGIKQKVAGKKITLNNLEQKELLQKYKDARLHFVLVCAAVSCPPIANYAYQPNQLEEQLEQRTRSAINDNQFIKVDDFAGKVELSKIFEWYAADFKPNAKSFINKYRTAALPTDAKTSYYVYNWTLNDASVMAKETASSETKSETDFEPIIAAATMPKNTFELNTFHTLYTSNYGDRDYGNRGSYFSSLFLFSYGLTGRFDIGVDFILKSYRANDIFSSSPFRALEFRKGVDSVTTPGGSRFAAISDFGLTHLGPRVRFAPFKKIGLSFEQAFYFPITGIPAGNTVDPALYWVTQIYYDKQFNSKFGLFVALTFWQPITPGQQFKFQVPYLKAFFSWYASKRFTLYATTTTFTEWGAGAKFLITPQFEIQALYTYYVPIPGLSEIYTGNGAKNVMTFNLGIRYRTSIVTK
ncbi:DUF547 domain-containing protein [Aureispira anguillae]|uniref:DUF547 domain-containing protein n=1 Tax=Aureispira anguillae TaxID=2864201 RepID=A0A916DWT9_9BACT|nr:DUF547 domain-containing protein [Aureispira anguillae]BDS14351.1 DUF547 domain-containing protein [Aureispira anguillae]